MDLWVDACIRSSHSDDCACASYLAKLRPWDGHVMLQRMPLERHPLSHPCWQVPRVSTFESTERIREITTGTILSFAMWQRTKPKDEKSPKAQRPRGKMEKWKGSAQVFDLKSGAKKVRRTVLYLDIFYVSFIVHLQAFSKCSSINNLTHSRIPHNSESARPLVVALGLLPAQCFSWDPFKEIYARYSEQQRATVSNSEQ